MSLQTVMNLLLAKLTEYLYKRKFTGKIIFTINCRGGAIAKCTTDIQETSLNVFVENNGCIVEKNS
jgi:hypothetical protein